ncbi:MAG TPA: hypothetical protein DCO79_02360 [Spirochaeta sp.]|nr:hypothetical protein [Spirochaeta sp.]
MMTKTNFTRTFRAQDSKGQDFLIEEYIVYEEVFSGKTSDWKELERLLFLNGSLVKFNEKDQTFIVMESNNILSLVS